MSSAPIVESLPQPADVRGRLADALRETELLRGLLRLSERAEKYRRIDSERSAKKRREVASAD